MSRLLVESEFIKEVMEQVSGVNTRQSVLTIVNSTTLFKTADRKKLKHEMEVVRLMFASLLGDEVVSPYDVETYLEKIVQSVNFKELVLNKVRKYTHTPKELKEYEYQERFIRTILKPVFEELGFEIDNRLNLLTEILKIEEGSNSLINLILRDLAIRVELGFDMYTDDLEFWSSVVIQLEACQSYKALSDYLTAKYGKRLPSYKDLFI